ncbi:MAG TPA: ATPase, T2SS/T4P/T4SS family [Acidimicrobiia bacterium]|nr:ATPase, T2SS/T4P/T4SS family [Acidimicrobiia bacterium]
MTVAPAYDEIRRRALEMVESTRIDPTADRDATRALVTGVVEEYQRRAHLGHGRALHDPHEMVERILRAVSELGPLTELLRRGDVEEVFIEGARVAYLDNAGRLRGLDQPSSEPENRHLVDRLLAETDRRLDASSPIVQARVLSGSARLTAVIPPIADHLSVTVRRYALRRETLASLVELGSLTVAAANFLGLAMRTTASFLVSGPPGSGKTSLLAALIHAVPSSQCIRCCEEVRELHVPLVHGSYYESRPSSLDGRGEISLRDLVKVVLAMRPDRIIVGEVRGAEAFELTRAVNAGCGFGCTVHANSARDALHALANAAMMAGENVAEPVVRRVFASSLDFVVHLDRDATGFSDGPVRRQVMEVLALVPALHDDFSTQLIFSRPRLGAPLDWTGALPPDDVAERIERVLPAGVGLADVLEGRANLL